MVNFETLEDYDHNVFTCDRVKLIVIKAVQHAFGLRLTNFEDADVIKELKRLESLCISFNILPNGIIQNESITPSKWTKTKSIIYLSLMTTNIFHLILLSAFDLSQDLSIIFGDFFYGHPSRRYFWLFWTNLSIFGEILRHYWIHLYRTGRPLISTCYIDTYEKGFNPEVLSLSPFYCQKYRFIIYHLASLWLRIIFLFGLGFGLTLVLIVQSASRMPKTSQQLFFIYFWLLISYFGLICTLTNIMLTGALVTIDLSYVYFRAATVTQTVRNFVHDRKFLQKRICLSEYEGTYQEIVNFLNDIEHRNLKVRNWLVFLYLGVSCSTNFGFYSAAIVHFDHGPLDIFIGSVSVLAIFAIGTCSYANGLILTMMHSCGKNTMKANRYLRLDTKLFIKFTDLRSRLSRTDIAFTIGSILDMTTRVFVIYLIENASLIMMFMVNVK